MRFFKLDRDIEMTGSVIQIEEAEAFGHFIVDDSFSALEDGPVHFTRPLIPILHHKAKLTPILRAAFIHPTYMLIEHELLQEIKKFRLPDFQQWPVEIVTEKTKKIIEGYFLFHIDKPCPVIDYGKSVFYNNKPSTYTEPETKHYVDITSHEQYIQERDLARQKKMQIGVDKLVMDFKNVEYDMIQVQSALASGLTGYYISEQLKYSLEEKFAGLIYVSPVDLNNKLSIQLA